MVEPSQRVLNGKQYAAPLSYVSVQTDDGQAFTIDESSYATPQYAKESILTPVNSITAFVAGTYSTFQLGPRYADLDNIRSAYLRLTITNSSGSAVALSPTWNFFQNLRWRTGAASELHNMYPESSLVIRDILPETELRSMLPIEGCFAQQETTELFTPAVGAGTFNSYPELYHSVNSLSAGAQIVLYCRIDHSTFLTSPGFIPSILEEPLFLDVFYNSDQQFSSGGAGTLQLNQIQLVLNGRKFLSKIRDDILRKAAVSRISIPFMYQQRDSQVGNLTSTVAGQSYEQSLTNFSGTFAALFLYFRYPQPNATVSVDLWEQGVAPYTYNISTGVATPRSLGENFDFTQINILPDGSAVLYGTFLDSAMAQVQLQDSCNNKAHLVNIMRSIKCLPFSISLLDDMLTHSHAGGGITLNPTTLLQFTTVATNASASLIAVAFRCANFILDHGRCGKQLL